MHTAPADLLETLTRLDDLLGAATRATFDDELSRAMTDVETIAFARVTESLGRRVDALRITAAGDLDTRSRPELGGERLSARNGCADGVDLISRVTGVAATTARTRIRQARAVAARSTLTGEPLPALFPAIRAALAAGAIGPDSVQAIVGTLAPIADRCDPAHLAAAEHELVAAATGHSPDGTPPCTADDTRTQAKVWVLALDPDGTLPEYERAVRRRGLAFGRESEGIVPLRGGLLADVAAQFQRLIDAYENPRVEDRTDDPGVVFREVPRDAAAPADPRTRSQRLHDVFASILGVAARSAEAPTLGGLPPTLLVTIAADELDRDDGVGFIDGTDGTVPAFVARQVGCCGGIQLLTFDERGRIIELGSPNRTFSGQQRRAIIARDGEYIIPGCHVRAAWCEIHHVIEYARGGPTHVDNGVPLCWWHHRTIETSGWQIRMVGGVPEVRGPAAIDPTGAWRRPAGSLHLARDRLRRRVKKRPTVPG